MAFEDLSLFERYSIGWSDGSLDDKLPNDPKVREELWQIGLLGPKDRELFEGHALFTVFGGDGRIQNIWAVGADGLSKFLPNRPRGPWNLPVTKHSRHVFVVADPLSALVLVAARYASVLAVDPDSGVVDVDASQGEGCATGFDHRRRHPGGIEVRSSPRCALCGHSLRCRGRHGRGRRTGVFEAARRPGAFPSGHGGVRRDARRRYSQLSSHA